MIFWNAVLGPITTAIARARHRARLTDGSIVPASDLGMMASRLAEEEIGNGEVGRNNHGPHVRRWGRGHDDIAHCSAFVCYQLEEAIKEFADDERYDALRALFADPRWQKWRLVAKRAWHELGKIGHHVALPLPGDIPLFERGRDGDWHGHLAITRGVTLGSDEFLDVEANVGKFPAKVKKIPRRLGHGRLIGFVRLP